MPSPAEPRGRGISAVVFDLFHTLVDPEDFRPRDFDRLEQVSGVLGVALEPFRRFWEGELAELAVCPDRPARRAAAYARAQGREVTAQQVTAVDDILGRYQDLALEHPRPEVVSALEGLRQLGYRLGLLSNAHERDVQAWPRSPLRRLIEVVCVSCFIGHAKPDPGAYETVLAALGVEAASAAYIADGGGGELAGARRHGFGLVVLVSGPALRSGLRDRDQVAALAEEADLHLAGVEQLAAALAGGRQTPSRAVAVRSGDPGRGAGAPCQGDEQVTRRVRPVAAEQFGEEHPTTQVVGAAPLAGTVRVGDPVLGHRGGIGTGRASLDSVPAQGLQAGVVHAQVVGDLVEDRPADLPA